jgi:lipoprotein-anchoring transpeptidase ErfK/SrfK
MNDLKKTLIAASCLVLSVVPVRSQTVPKTPTNVTAVAVVTASTRPVSDTLTKLPDARSTLAPVERVIVVSLEDRRLALVQDGVVKKVYRVAVGRENTPSPTGTFTIVDRVENPTYYHEGQVIEPGPANPVGTRWIGLDRKGYGIHGTNLPRSIGKAASHGCIRMRRRDLEELFAQVRGGDQVEIVGERNDETAAIFGEPVLPGMTAPALTVTAQATTEAPAQTTASDAAATAMVPAMVPANR